MESQVCNQCKKITNTTDNRLVRDSCGHSKCRRCLVREKDGCLTCLLSVRQNYATDSPNDGNEYLAPRPLPPKSKQNKDRGKLRNKAAAFKQRQLVTIEQLQEELLKEKQSQSILIGKEQENGNKQIESMVVNVRKKRDSNLWPKNVTIEKGSDGKLFYCCTVCEKRFRARSHVAYHAYCDGLRKPYICSVCQKGFASRSHYEYHMRVHEGTRPFICDICKAGFYQRSKLKRHILKHTGEKSFTCLDCGAAFNNAASLRKHGYIHSGLKPHKCNTCGKEFRDSSNLRKHETKHKDVKYTCDVCGKTYGMKWSLAVHSKSHGAVRPYTCEHCPRAFYSNKDKRRHVMVHSETKPFRCTLCSTRFRRKDNLDRHLRNTHPGMDTSQAVELVTDDGTRADEWINGNILPYMPIEFPVTHMQNIIPNKDSSVSELDKCGSSFSKVSEWIANSVNVESYGHDIDCIPSDMKVNDEEKTSSLIFEENNKRESVIFGPIKSITNNPKHTEPETGDISEESDSANKNYKYFKKKFNPIDIYRKILTPAKVDKSIENKTLENVNVLSKEKTPSTEYISPKPWPEYIHKKVNYGLTNVLHRNNSTFDNVKLPLTAEDNLKVPIEKTETVKATEYYSPESIELYKKILNPSYKGKSSGDEINCVEKSGSSQSDIEINGSSEERNVATQSANVMPSSSSSADMHWRRRMAHSSNQEL